MGVLVGILIVLGVWLRDSEITAMRASGIGVWHFARMLSLFRYVGLGLGDAQQACGWHPRANLRWCKLQDRLKTSQASFEVLAARIL